MVHAWPFDPAWPPSGQAVEDTFSFQTEIITSRSGRESRRARREAPRRAVRHGLILHGEDLRLYKDILWNWQPQDFVMADIVRRVTLPATLSAGASTFTLGSPAGWMVAGLTLILGTGEDREDREVLTIDSVAGSVVTLTTAALATWPADTPVYAGLLGNLATSMSADRQTTNVATAEVSFTVRPLSEPARAVSAAPLLLDDREVFLRRPNWLERVASAMSHEVDILDYGVGPIYRYAPVPFGQEITGATYLGRNVAEVDDILDVFFRMRGRQGELWMPTWEPDFLLRGTSSAGSSTVRVKGPRVAEMYAASATHRAIFALREDGSVALHKTASITAVNDGQGNDSLINLITPLTQDLSSTITVITGWLLLRRFASDSLTVEWLTHSVANLRLNLTTLEMRPPESP